METISFGGLFYDGKEQNNYGIKPEAQKITLIFKNIDASKITDIMSIGIVSVDGIAAETAGLNGYIKISTGRL